MAKTEEAGILKREKKYVKFMQLLRKAEADGRLDGKFKCRVCGMLFQEKEQAEGCCKVTIA